MHFRIVGFVLFSAASVAASANAQTPPAAPAITRTVVAATKLSTVVAVPLHFRAVSVTIRPGEGSSFSGGDGVLYQISGSTEVSIDGGVKTIGAGEGFLIASGKQVSLKAGERRTIELPPFPSCCDDRPESAGRGRTCCCERDLPHGGTDPRLEAWWL